MHLNTKNKDLFVFFPIYRKRLTKGFNENVFLLIKKDCKYSFFQVLMIENVYIHALVNRKCSILYIKQQ